MDCCRRNWLGGSRCAVLVEAAEQKQLHVSLAFSITTLLRGRILTSATCSCLNRAARAERQQGEGASQCHDWITLDWLNQMVCICTCFEADHIAVPASSNAPTLALPFPDHRPDPPKILRQQWQSRRSSARSNRRL